MKLDGCRVILTGANGGIGSAVARALGARGARLALVGIDAAGLAALADELRTAGVDAVPLVFDLSADQGQERLVEDAASALGGVDVLINNAGVLNFGAFAAEAAEAITRLVKVNVQGPLLLTRAVLPRLLAQSRGQIVNVGSIFGSIGFAWFSSYSSSKFAMRGFSESLRRELDGTGVDVTYVAPRATRTPLNNSAMLRMAEAVGMRFDEAEVVAEKIVRAVESDAKDRYLGFPESLFVRINGLLPRLVDNATRKQNRIAGQFAPGGEGRAQP